MELFLISNMATMAMCVINFAMHALGSCLLISIYKRGKKTAQHLFLINLSMAEAMMNFCRILYLILIFNELYIHSVDLRVTNINIASVFGATGIQYIYYLAMFYITTDRILLTLLTVNYSVHCTRGRAKKLILCTWVINLFISLTSSLVAYFVGWNNFNELTYKNTFFVHPYIH